MTYRQIGNDEGQYPSTKEVSKDRESHSNNAVFDGEHLHNLVGV